MKKSYLIPILILVFALAAGAWYWMGQPKSGHCHSLQEMETNVEGTQYKIVKTNIEIPEIELISQLGQKVSFTGFIHQKRLNDWHQCQRSTPGPHHAQVSSR